MGASGLPRLTRSNPPFEGGSDEILNDFRGFSWVYATLADRPFRNFMLTQVASRREEYLHRAALADRARERMPTRPTVAALK